MELTMIRKMTRRIIVAPAIGRVHGSWNFHALDVVDRRANGTAFPGERIVRVPRRLARRVMARGCTDYAVGAILGSRPDPYSWIVHPEWLRRCDD
jgi:hypothetical protein